MSMYCPNCESRINGGLLNDFSPVRRKPLTIPDYFINQIRMNPDSALGFIVDQGMLIVVDPNMGESQRRTVANGLLRAMKALDLYDEVEEDGFSIPIELLIDAGLTPWDELEYTAEAGRITIKRRSYDDEEENCSEDWEDWEDDDVLGALPNELRDLLEDLKIRPSVAKEVLLEGGYSFE